MRLLLIEDEALLREQLRERLKAEGHVVDTAADGEEGVFAGSEFDAACHRRLVCRSHRGCQAGRLSVGCFTRQLDRHVRGDQADRDRFQPQIRGPEPRPVGTLVEARQLQRVERLLDEAQEAGGNVTGMATRHGS